MTRKSIGEYARAVRPRYLRASKTEKKAILDEFCLTTGYHRKSAIRLLGRQGGSPPPARGRPAKYGLGVAQALKTVWEASDRICSKRLAPFLPELVASLVHHGELAVSEEVQAQLMGLSAATIDRLLGPLRPKGLRRAYTSTPSQDAIKALVPIRTFADWQGVAPGCLQADLVGHCGESTRGFYLTTLVTVDVATGWVECEAIWGKRQERVGGGLHRITLRLPFALKALHTDNGGEFLNQVLYPYLRKRGIAFTRGRPYKKNDQAYAEQKNWVLVRKTVGYDRYASREALAALTRVYERLRLWFNFFQPLRKVSGRERVGAKVRKRYDTARTPYRRLLEAGVLDDASEAKLRRLYQSLNPVALRAEIEEALERLWALAEHPQPGNPDQAKVCG